MKCMCKEKVEGDLNTYLSPLPAPRATAGQGESSPASYPHLQAPHLPALASYPLWD